MILIIFAALACLQTPPADGQHPTPAAIPKSPTTTQVTPEPGVLPADTSPEARKLWSAMIAALRPKTTGEVAAEINAFDFKITTRVTSVTPDGSHQKNDVQLRYCYLGPNFVKRIMLDLKNVESMHGPDGDWLWDPDKNDRIPLVGSDYAQDRRENLQMLSMAHNYLALSEPGRLRVAHLERLDKPPAALPAIDPKDPATPKDSALTLAASLDWISFTSSDLQVIEPVKSKEQPSFRALIGLDPKSHLPLVNMIFQDDHGTLVNETAVLIDFTTDPKNYGTIDGHLVPKYWRKHDPLMPSSPFTFEKEARLAVFIDTASSTLHPKLTADDFRPPKQK